MPDLRGTTVTWLGHSVVLIVTASGTKILIDPFIDKNPVYPKDFALPEKIDLLLLTHGHFDHIADAIPVAKKHGPRTLGVAELTSYLESKGVENTHGMNYGGSFRHQDVTITVVEAKHSSGIQDGDTIIYGGNPVGFIIQIEDGPTLYHAGDTSLFSDMKLIAELYAPEFGMLPIGDNYTMGPKTAAMAAKYLLLKSILPLHYGTFPALTGTPDELVTWLGSDAIEVMRVKPGESIR
jgi:L-ascorbate metabolism protein UlaG (beta-lactamase superfamily)